MIEEDQGLQALQAYGVDVEEVAGDHGGGLGGQELAPGWTAAPRGRIDSRGVRGLPDGRGGDRVSELARSP
ncbi:hypothetical protein AB0H34_36915 [Saccharopolyspora shandongensis]|uniref:hypothetical protein n=1 Tax=Saccharopolyspora shandongensis TaxID=418495 RepID=UPI0033F17FB0